MLIHHNLCQLLQLPISVNTLSLSFSMSILSLMSLFYHSYLLSVSSVSLLCLSLFLTPLSLPILDFIFYNLANTEEKYQYLWGKI